MTDKIKNLCLRTATGIAFVAVLVGGILWSNVTSVSYTHLDVYKRQERTQYESKMQQVNRHLKKIGQQLGLPIPLTTYCARHSWATIARDRNVPLAVISEALGHDNEQTTRIYLDSIRTSVVDDANRMIIEGL